MNDKNFFTADYAIARGWIPVVQAPLPRREASKLDHALAWMKSQGVHQLGTEHERQNKNPSADGARALEDRVQHAGQIGWQRESAGSCWPESARRRYQK